jgi:hypothetical protein
MVYGACHTKSIILRFCLERARHEGRS